jgi:effector-binding domain-containing protein
MVKIFFIILLAVLVLAVIAYLYLPKGAKYSDYAFLVEPRFTTLPSEKVIEVKATGDPLKTVQPALSLLYKTYFRLEGVNKGGRFPAPKARWFAEKDSPRDSWEGHFAIPVPDAVTHIPEIKDKSGLTVELTSWEYGQVAEILHVGPYDKELPTYNKLAKFIEDQGFVYAGPHEEEYLKGPMPFMPTNPAKYLTIIRYRVKKAE